ncbi:hypothetical protein [Tessaracoccus sp.]
MGKDQLEVQGRADESFTGHCPVKDCGVSKRADAETLVSVLALHLRDEHGQVMSVANQAASAAVQRGQETAFKVGRMELVLAEVFGGASPAQARSVLKGLAGQGLVIRVAAGTRSWGRPAGR